jgi:hypothetical protein
MRNLRTNITMLAEFGAVRKRSSIAKATKSLATALHMAAGRQPGRREMAKRMIAARSVARTGRYRGGTAIRYPTRAALEARDVRVAPNL